MKKEITKSLIVKNQKYAFENAVNMLKKISTRNFNESVEVSIHLNVVPKKNIIIKGFSILPYNIGKKYNIAVFNEHHDLEDCIHLNEDDLKNLNKKNISFNILLTSPTSVVKLGKINKLLNGKRLMPDIKYGTINTDINNMIKSLKSNYVKFKTDKNFTLNVLIGKLNLSVDELKINIETLIMDIKKQKPQNCKSISIKNIIISSTMGPGIKIDTDTINF